MIVRVTEINAIVKLACLLIPSYESTVYMFDHNIMRRLPKLSRKFQAAAVILFDFGLSTALQAAPPASIVLHNGTSVGIKNKLKPPYLPNTTSRLRRHCSINRRKQGNVFYTAKMATPLLHVVPACIGAQLLCNNPTGTC